VAINSGQEQITIGLVMPNRNHARYLPDSLSSIAKQTRQPDEVIIIDDGSSDDSVSVITRFLNDHPTWRLIQHPERRGVVARLNEGMTAVRSNWCAILAADDLQNPKYLEMAGEMAARYPSAGLICGCVEIFDQSGRRRLRPPILPRIAGGYVSPDEFRELLRISDNFFIGTVTMFRRKTVLDIGCFKEELGSICDGYLGRQVAARHGFGFIPEVLGYWRLHGQNFSVSTSTEPKVLEQGIQAVRTVLKQEPAGMFPSNYGDLLDRRLRFGGARLLALDRSIPAEARAERIAALLHAGRLERCVLAVLMTAGVLGSIAALAWLTIRLRPLSLPRLLRHMLVRRSILAAAEGPATTIE
jgi:glycosyltransferase involved in cell wall biosynthesis